jgi:peptidylprolyl isomerase
MTTAKQGDTVQVHYTGKLEDGTVFDSSANREPLQFTIGAGQIITGFEHAVVGMTPGESKSATIVADQAYGQHREDMVLQVERDQFPSHISPEVGQRLQISQPNGQPIVVTITDVSQVNVTLDANHPLAGQDLTFDIELVAID